MPVSGRPVNKKARMIAFLVIFLLIVGVPATLYFINRNNPVDPIINKVTVEYYKEGVKTSIPESNAIFETLKSDAQSMVTFAETYDEVTSIADAATNAKNDEAIEITFGSSEYVSFLNVNATGSIQYKKLLLIPTPNRSTIRILLGYTDYRTGDAIYNGSLAYSYFSDAREAVNALKNTNTVTSNENTTNQ